MISIRCGQCSKDLKVKDELSGKKIKCPGCGKVVAVPALAEGPASRTGASKDQDSQTLPPRESLPRTLDEGQVPKPRGSVSDATRPPGPGEPAHDSSLTDFLAPPEADDELGRLGGFRILKILGHGGMGVVFQGEDAKLGRKVAIKAMLPHLAGSKSSQDRFLREARSAAALEHDNIVPILQVGEDRGVPFIAMPFLKGEPLDERLKRDKVLSIAEVLRIGRETAKGLGAAHEARLIHRDIKPANLWLEGAEGRVKILDFGLARAAVDNTQLTQQGAIIGTPAYMAPEQGSGSPVDARCDLFSLGCVLYRMATGRLPFSGTDTVSTLVAVATETPSPPRELRAELPQALSDLAMQLLAKKPADRPQSAREVAEALAEIEARESAAPPTPTSRQHKASGTKQIEAPSTQLGQPTKKRPPTTWLVAGGVLGVAGVCLLLIFVLRPRSNQTPRPPAPPFAVAPFDAATAKAHQEVWAKYLRVLVEQTNSIGMKLVLIPPGKFLMGSPEKEAKSKHETPRHEVTLSRVYFLGAHEVTVGQFTEFVNATNFEIKPGGYSGPTLGKNPKLHWQDPGCVQSAEHPVTCVSWEDANAFCSWLSKKENKRYRLPSEAEWEHACRAGSSDRFFFGDANGAALSKYGNSNLRNAQPVGQLLANPWGLFDIYGNVWEWCLDSYDQKSGYDPAPVTDPKGTPSAPFRMVRGGGWTTGNMAGYNLSAYRYIYSPTPPDLRFNGLGFRVVLEGPDHTDGVPAKIAPSLPPAMFTNSLGMEFVMIPKGKSSWLRVGPGKAGSKEVEFKEDFYLGVCEVTQEEWTQVMGSNPSQFQAVAGVAKEDQKRFPVESVSYQDCQAFVESMNRKMLETGWAYRLPTRLEWEYACRGGPFANEFDSGFAFYFDKPSNELRPDQANYAHANGLKRTCKVGSYQPNRLGLYDMHGNVSEWCDDPDAAGKGSALRPYMGGNWLTVIQVHCGAGSLSYRSPMDKKSDCGLRLARVSVGKLEPKAGTTLAPRNGPIHLLPLLDLPKAILAGAWKADPDGSMRTVPEPRGRYHLRFPVSVHGDYRLKLEFTHHGDMEVVSMILPVGLAEAEAVIGSNNNNRSGLGSIEGKPFNENETTRRKMGFVKDKRNTVIIEVRADAQNAKVTADWNGDKFVNWSGPVAKLSLPKERTRVDRTFLEVSLADRCSNTQFHSVTLEMLSGEAHLVRP